MPTADDLGPQLSRRLTYLLKRAALELEELHQQHLAPAGISARELGVLLLLNAREPESQQQAASRLGIDRTTMVALIDQLEDAGLATRRPSAKDRRAREIAITPKGRRLLQRARRMISGVDDEVLAGLTAQEREDLLTLLRQALDSAPAQPPWSSEEGD